MTCGDHGGRKSNGDPCGRQCQTGFNRCSMHGGKTPAVILKSQMALALARLPACEALYLILERFLSNTCATCGFPNGDMKEQSRVIRAAQVVLDRSGMGPQATLLMTKQSDGDLNLGLLTAEERGRLLAALAEINDVKRTVRERQLGPMGASPLDADPDTMSTH